MAEKGWLIPKHGPALRSVRLRRVVWPLTKRILRRLLSARARNTIQRIIGTIDYARSPQQGAGWGPFNGQTARQALFVELIANIRPYAIVETGTFLGATTELMSQTGLPIFSIDLHPRNYGFARARFWRRGNVKLFHGDSRTCLLGLLGGALRPLAGLTVFFYLDAHWNDDLPLADEIDIIFSGWPMAIVMIDDFEVPSDTGYGFDDYGPGKALISAYVRSAMAAHQLQAFYPSTPSTADYPSTLAAATGLATPGRLRRGCIILAKEAFHGQVLASMSLLRAANEVELQGNW